MENKKIKILVIDDNKDNLTTVKALVKEAFPDSIRLTAANGAAGIELAQSEDPDVILLDVVMPGMDGFEVCQKLKSNPKTRDIPVVFLTALGGDRRSRIRALEVGGDAFLAKPIDESELTAQIRVMVKIKITNEIQRNEKERLAQLVAEQTRELEQTHSATLNLLEDLREENEARKKSEERLVRSENRLKKAQSIAHVGDWEWNIKDGQEEWSDELYHIFGIDKTSYIGSLGEVITRMIHPEDLPIVLPSNTETFAEKKPLEYRIICPDGSIRNIWAESGDAILDESGEPIFLIGIVQDITARKQSELSLLLYAKRQEKIAALGRALASEFDLEVIYHTAEGYIQSMIACPNFAFTLFDSQQGILKAAYVSSDGIKIDVHDIPPLKFNLQNTSSGRSKAIASQSPEIILDMKAKRKTGGGMLFGGAQKAQSAIYIPMLAEGQVIGLMELQSYQTGAYSFEDGEWLSVAANQIGMSIQNARLFSRTQQRIEELTALAIIDNAVTSHLSPQEMFTILLEQAITQLKVDAAVLFLFNPQSQVLECVSSSGYTLTSNLQIRLHMGESLAGQVALEKRMFHFTRLSAENAHLLKEESLIEGFEEYFGVPLLVKDEIIGVLEVLHRSKLNPDSDWLHFLEVLAGQSAIVISTLQLYEDVQHANKQLLKAYDATIEGWSQAMDLRDKETENHTQRVTEMTLRLAQCYGMSEGQMIHLRRGALLHDIGKLGVPDQILLKVSDLTDEEWTIMRSHPQLAYDMLSQIDYLRPAMDIPYCHHERWDGSGYPRGLKGEQIPFAARLFSVVDVYDALTSDRPYRPRWSQEKAIQLIKEQSEKFFDPIVVEVIFEHIYRRNGKRRSVNPPYAAALTLSAIVSMVVMIIAWRRRSSAGAVALTVAMLGLTVWAFTYAVRWLSSSQVAQYFWLDATYFGVVITPTAFLILAVQFTSPANKFIRKHLGLFFIEPVITVLMLWTDPWHGLFYAGMQSTGTILNGGVWFWVNVIYSYILLLIALWLLIQAFRNATHLLRKQVGVMVAGMLLPWIGNVIGLTHISPFPELDLTPILFIGSGVIFAQGLFHYRLLDIVPIARHKLVESMSDGVIVLDTQHRIVDINPAAQRIAGLSEIGIGQFADETFMPWTTLSQVLRTETETSREIQVNQASPQNYEVRISPLVDQHQNLTGRLIILRNITKRMHIDEELRKSEERFRSVVQTATDAIVTADASGKIVTWNRGAVNIFQYSETEILGRPLTLLMPKVYRDKHQAGMRQLATGGEPHIIGQIVKIIGLRKDGVEIPIELVLSKWQSGKEMFFTGIIRDISERQKLEDTLLYQSTHDFLTGLFNRQYFETEIERLQQNRKFPISILMMDVDGLKKINDTLGHSAGDDLLRRLAQVLRDVFRREDLVARIGGDEFVAILPNTNSAMAIQVMQRLKSSIDQNNLNYPAYQTLNLSIGAACRDESSSLDEILKLADQAMYLEKQRKTIG